MSHRRFRFRGGQYIWSIFRLVINCGLDSRIICVLNAIVLVLQITNRPRGHVCVIQSTRLAINRDLVWDSVFVDSQLVLSHCGYSEPFNCLRQQFGICFSCEPVSSSLGKRGSVSVNEKRLPRIAVVVVLSDRIARCTVEAPVWCCGRSLVALCESSCEKNPVKSLYIYSSQ